MNRTPVVFRALADRTRLRLLNLLRDREVCVCDLMRAVGQSQPKVSRHLSYLKRAGLVRDRRDGYWRHYSLAASGPMRRAVVACLNAWRSEDNAAAADMRKLGGTAGRCR